jgi:membrane protein implicated in regulation of membrane protease activity
MRNGVQALIGETALVTKAINGKHQPGTVRLRGEEWFAIPLDPEGLIKLGKDVVVADVDRGLLVVYPAESA